MLKTEKIEDMDLLRVAKTLRKGTLISFLSTHNTSLEFLN